MMIDELLKTVGLRERSRTERAKETVDDVIHSIGDALDRVVGDSRERAGAGAEAATKVSGKVAEKVAEVASEATDRSREQAGTVAEAAAAATEVVGDAASGALDLSEEKVQAALAALGALTANWDEVAGALGDEMKRRREALGGSDSDESEKKSDKKAEKKSRKEKKQKKKQKGYPGFWLWLLRLGVGAWFVERLRGRDIPAYIDHGAGDEMRRQSENHPIVWYKDLLDNLMIPNASVVGLLTVIGEGLTALGSITGMRRRTTALLGLLLSGNQLLADYADHEKRGQHLVASLVQALLLRTGA